MPVLIVAIHHEVESEEVGCQIVANACWEGGVGKTDSMEYDVQLRQRRLNSA